MAGVRTGAECLYQSKVIRPQVVRGLSQSLPITLFCNLFGLEWSSLIFPVHEKLLLVLDSVLRSSVLVIVLVVTAEGIGDQMVLNGSGSHAARCITRVCGEFYVPVILCVRGACCLVYIEEGERTQGERA